MDLSDRDDNYLIKTYCFLQEKMLPQNSENMRIFPPPDMWQGVRDELEKAMTIIDNELRQRGIDIRTYECSALNFWLS